MLLERLLHLARREPLVDEPEHEARVDAARAGRHDDPLERREAHRRVERAAVAHRGERRAGAEVAGDDPRARVQAEQLGGPTGGVRVGEPVEAVAAQREPLAPCGGQRVRRRRRRQVRVERRVEARHRRAGRPATSRDRVGRRQRLGLVQRRQRREPLELARTARRRAPPPRCARPPCTKRCATASASPSRSIAARERAGVDPPPGGLGLVFAEQLVVVAEQPELDAARARVDGEDAHQAPGGRGMRPVQSRTSGASSPCSRVYWRSRSRVVDHRLAQPGDARAPSPGTRSMTSMTRW